MGDVILGSIMYLNPQEVDNLLESIEGGLVDQFRETTKETSSKAGGGSLGIPGTGVSVKGDLESIREEAREAVRQQGPVSRLVALRKILIENDYVQYFNTTDVATRDTLSEGALVEVSGQLTASAFGQVVDMASRMMGLNTMLGGAFGKIDAETEQALRYMEHVTSNGIAAYVEPEKLDTAKRKFDFACIFSPDYLRVSKGELGGRVNVLGRIRKIPARNEVEYLYELIPGATHLPRNDMKSLIKQLSSDDTFSISERDLRLRYPDVLVTPLAAYS